MTDLSDPSWLDESRRRLVSHVNGFVAAAAENPAQLELLSTALQEMRALRAPRGAYVASVHLPLLVAAAQRGAREDDIRCAAVTALLETGFDLLDHIADRELGAHWARVPPGLIQLAATGFLCALPQLALSRLELEPARVAALHASLAEHLVRIGAGQQTDLASAGAERGDARQALASVVRKTGQRRALFADLAARYAGADAEQAARFARFARELGVALQLASDLGDLFSGEPSRDLAAATRTWPIAWLLERAEDAARPEVLTLLERARTDQEAQREVRERLRATGALLRSFLEIELHKQRALRTLRDAAPDGAARRRLGEWILSIAAA